ncbi:3-oxoacyl-[acyl-carrier-protein] synthase III C-terminal domain-containing protein [Microbispora sp. NPDC088329]|uniref:3-oxoacyl-ACP synthase III family protein n=1 Tax=Microbispora sp. NPDC088329 TaxID=3154869 RepID=UPI00342BAD24
MTVTIDRVGSFIPEASLGMEELRDLLGLPDTQLSTYRRFLGYERVASADGIPLPDLLASAARRALDGADPAGVRYLIYAQTVPQAPPPGVNTVDRLRATLGLENAVAFSVSHQNCATGLYAVQLAGHLLSAEQDGRALVVMGERAFCPEMRFIPNVALLGEASAAVLVGSGGSGDRVLSGAFRLHGKFYAGRHIEKENMRELIGLYVRTFADVIGEAVHRAGLKPSDIALVLPHNVSRLSWLGVSGALDIPLSKIFLDNVPKFGHLFCADPFVNLDAARRAGLLRPGDAVVLACVGIGAAFGALVVRIGTGGD